jgi:hypothetical protein
MPDASDLRAAREHAALLKDLSALCAKYTACPAGQPITVEPDWAAMIDPSDWVGALRYTMPDDPSAAGIIYIAGPMSGKTDHNYPAFNAMAEQLRAAGHTVINPAEIHPDTEHPWDWYLRRDLAELVKCSRVVFLDDWFISKGARLEHHVARALGLELIYPHDVHRIIEHPNKCLTCDNSVPACFNGGCK